MAAAPQPPSLHLPRQVKDLKATRSGNTVELAWTSPKETTDRLKLRGPIKFHICRAQGKAACQTIATTTGAPGKAATYTDVLSATVASGTLRDSEYKVYGLNDHDKSAGPSNSAPALLGTAPPAVVQLTAAMSERGVVLRWQPSAETAGMQIQLHRTLLSATASRNKSSSQGASTTPAEQTLSVGTGSSGRDPGMALDPGVQFDQTYRYTAVRIVTVPLGKQTLQAASATSQPVVITPRDIFPPAAPTGLAAVPVSAAMNGGHPEVDLSWSANTEPDLAQYRVYRREVQNTPHPGNSHFQQIASDSNGQLIVAPAFRDLQVEPGHTYAYTVTAVDATGNESPRSAELRVTVPAT